MKRPPAGTDPHAKCGACGHSPAYHDGQYKRPCRAWNPDCDDTMCACKGWQEPKPPPTPATPPENA